MRRAALDLLRSSGSASHFTTEISRIAFNKKEDSSVRCGALRMLISSGSASHFTTEISHIAFNKKENSSVRYDALKAIKSSGSVSKFMPQIRQMVLNDQRSSSLHKFAFELLLSSTLRDIADRPPIRLNNASTLSSNEASSSRSAHESSSPEQGKEARQEEQSLDRIKGIFKKYFQLKERLYQERLKYLQNLERVDYSRMGAIREEGGA